MIKKSTLDYLNDLRNNNTKPWFEKNKDRYMAAHANMIDFAEALIDEVAKIDKIVPVTGKKSLMRIYRDVRFSKDKTPYKSYWGGGIKRATKALRGGMYYHIEPAGFKKNSSPTNAKGHGNMIAGGFWNPDPKDLKRIREEIANDDKPLRKIVAAKKFKEYFGELHGEKVKSAPRGFNKDHKAIDLLRHKQFLLYRRFSDKEIMADSFVKEAAKTYKAMHPFFNYLSDVLTTDANGVKIV